MASVARQNILGTAVRRNRHAAEMSLSDLATQVEVSKAHLSRIESGERSPSISVLTRISIALGVGLSDLLPAAEDEHPVIRAKGPIVRADDLEVRRLSNRVDAVIQPIQVQIPRNRR